MEGEEEEAVAWAGLAEVEDLEEEEVGDEAEDEEEPLHLTPPTLARATHPLSGGPWTPVKWLKLEQQELQMKPLEEPGLEQQELLEQMLTQQHQPQLPGQALGSGGAEASGQYGPQQSLT